MQRRQGIRRICTLTFCRCDWLVTFAFARRQALFADMIPNPAQEAHIIREAGFESTVPARTTEEGTFLDCLVGDATFSAEADASSRLMNGGSILASCGDNSACRSRCCSWATCLLPVSLTANLLSMGWCCVPLRRRCQAWSTAAEWFWLDGGFWSSGRYESGAWMSCHQWPVLA